MLRRRRRPKVVPRAAADFVRQLKTNLKQRLLNNKETSVVVDVADMAWGHSKAMLTPIYGNFFKELNIY